MMRTGSHTKIGGVWARQKLAKVCYLCWQKLLRVCSLYRKRVLSISPKCAPYTALISKRFAECSLCRFDHASTCTLHTQGCCRVSTCKCTKDSMCLLISDVPSDKRGKCTTCTRLSALKYTICTRLSVFKYTVHTSLSVLTYTRALPCENFWPDACCLGIHYLF